MFAQARAWTRRDYEAFDEMVAMGLLRLHEPLPKPQDPNADRATWVYELTDFGVEVADMGEVDHTVLAKAAGVSTAYTVHSAASMTKPKSPQKGRPHARKPAGARAR